jgi:hypothetical protein
VSQKANQDRAPYDLTLGFAGAGFSTKFKEVFPLGTLSYFNGTTMGGEASSVDLQVTITLTTPEGISQPVSQTLGLINSTNIEGDPKRVRMWCSCPRRFQR